MTKMAIKSDDGYECPSPVIYLNDDQVEALGIKGLPAPGTTYTLTVQAVATQVTASVEEPDEKDEEGSEPDVALALTLTDIEVSNQQGPDAAQVLYGA